MNSISGLGTAKLFDAKFIKVMKANGQGGPGDLPIKETTPSQPVETASNNISFASKNMMAGNFVSSGFVEDHQSKYIKAQQAGQDAVNMQGNRQDAILNSAMAELEALRPEEKRDYSKRTLIGIKAERRIMDERQQASIEASKRNLDEQKESIEERANNAVDASSSDESSQTDKVQPIPIENQASIESEAAQPTKTEYEITELESSKPASSTTSIDIIV